MDFYPSGRSFISLHLTSVQFSSVTQSCLTLWPHALQHARISCPSPTPRACSNSCLMLSNHLTLCLPLLLLPSVFPSIRVFSKESVLCIRWPKYWSFSFSISLSSECSGYCNSQIHRDRKWTRGYHNLRRGGHGELVFREKRVSVWEDKNVPEMDGGDGYKMVRMYLVLLNYTL